MIAKRIPHKTECDHAQTPYARRKCRAAKLAATRAAEEITMRYTVQMINGRYTVLDHGQPIGALYTSYDEQIIQTMARNLNANDGKPARLAQPEPAGPRRLTRSRRSHPFGQAIEAGDGYTIYEDTAFGGGRVQIWDES